MAFVKKTSQPKQEIEELVICLPKEEIRLLERKASAAGQVLRDFIMRRVNGWDALVTDRDTLREKLQRPARKKKSED